MIANLFRLLGWEWFKLRKRAMPGVLLAFLLLIALLPVVSGYISYTNRQKSGGVVPLTSADGSFQLIACNQLRQDASAAVPAGTSTEVIAGLEAQCSQEAAQQETLLQQRYASFTLPGSLPGVYSMVSNMGFILLAILGATLIGSEYSLGTLRPMLVRGVGRTTYLAAKFLLLILATAGALLIASLVAGLAGLVLSAFASAPAGGQAALSTWADAGMALLKTWLSFIPFIALIILLGVLTRSTAAAMGISLGYYFFEGVLIVIFSSIFEGFDQIANYLLINNINLFLGYGSSMINTTLLSSAQPSSSQAGALLALYTLLMAAVTAWIFHRRDITGPSGG